MMRYLSPILALAVVAVLPPLGVTAPLPKNLIEADILGRPAVVRSFHPDSIRLLHSRNRMEPTF